MTFDHVSNVFDVAFLPPKWDLKVERVCNLGEGLANGGEPIEDAAQAAGDHLASSLQQGWRLRGGGGGGLSCGGGGGRGR